MCFKQIPVLFKVYADFECISNSLEDNEGPCSKIALSKKSIASIKHGINTNEAVFYCER